MSTQSTSGKREGRAGLAPCLKALRESDTLAVWKMDRLGRDLRHLGVRELRRAGCAPTPAPVVIDLGIDDWALARGHRYGKIVVDVERHCPIKLLAGRDEPTEVSRLKEQPCTEVVARDRASAYADAARTAAPDAEQVADRWHLLGNPRDNVKRVLLRCPDKLKESSHPASKALQFEAVPAEVLVGSNADGNVPDEPPLEARQRYSNARRQGRLSRYEEVMRFWRSKKAELSKLLSRLLLKTSKVELAGLLAAAGSAVC